MAKPVFPGRELLASHVGEGEAQHEGDQRVASVLLEGGHVFTQGVLVGARHQAVVSIQDSKGQVVRSPRHEPHQEPSCVSCVTTHCCVFFLNLDRKVCHSICRAM